MHQERCPAVEVRAHQIDTALRVFPAFDHDILELLVQELFSCLLERWIDFDKIRQDAYWSEVLRLTPLDGCKETLHALGRVCAMRKDFFEGILPSLETRRFRPQMIE